MQSAWSLVTSATLIRACAGTSLAIGHDQAAITEQQMSDLAVPISEYKPADLPDSIPTGCVSLDSGT